MRKSLSLFVSLFALSLFPGVVRAGELLERVRLVYGAQLEAVESLKLKYTYRVNDHPMTVEYSCEGKKHRQSCVTLTDGGFSGVREVSWNGLYSYRRRELGQVERSSDPSMASSLAPTPHQAMGEYVNEALWTPSYAKDPFALTSERSIRDRGKTLVELSFETKATGFRLVTRHDADQGYHPVYWELSKGGQLLAKMEDVRYKKNESNGNSIFYPIYFSEQTYNKSAVANNIRFLVESNSFEMNPTTTEIDFTLAPYPNEELVIAKGGQVITPVADPNWDPRGKVHFPWSAVLPILDTMTNLGSAKPPKMASPSPANVPIVPLGVEPDAEVVSNSVAKPLWIVVTVVSGIVVMVVITFRRRPA